MGWRGNVHTCPSGTPTVRGASIDELDSRRRRCPTDGEGQANAAAGGRDEATAASRCARRADERDGGNPPLARSLQGGRRLAALRRRHRRAEQDPAWEAPLLPFPLTSADSRTVADDWPAAHVSRPRAVGLWRPLDLFLPVVLAGWRSGTNIPWL